MVSTGIQNKAPIGRWAGSNWDWESGTHKEGPTQWPFLGYGH